MVEHVNTWLDDPLDFVGQLRSRHLSVSTQSSGRFSAFSTGSSLSSRSSVASSNSAFLHPRGRTSAASSVSSWSDSYPSFRELRNTDFKGTEGSRHECM
jgi:hypothetical protein